MKKIKKQRLSLESAVVRNLDDQQLGNVVGANCGYTILPPLTTNACARCTAGYSGCVNPN